MLRINLTRRRQWRLGIRSSLIVLGAVLAFFSGIHLELRDFKTAGFYAFGVLIIAVLEFVIADIIVDAQFPAQTEYVLGRIDKNLLGLHRQIVECIGRAIDSFGGCDTSKVSGTFHLKVFLYSEENQVTEPSLLQITDYRGGLGGRRWRFHDSSKGIVGRCLRTGEREWVNFSSIEEYKELMVKWFGYSKDEMKTHTQQARSYLAEPIYSANDLVGVLYFFSIEPQVFPLAVNEGMLQQTRAEIVAFLKGARIL